MAWSIAEVSRMSGVTSRTLRHYDAIGLLPPAYVHRNGHRYYETGQLLRLQQILLLRELGVSLGEIATAVGSGPDAVTALRRHHARLLAEGKRLNRLSDTVARTITELEGETSMSTPRINRPENLFDGLDPAGYDDEARARWPDLYDQAQQVVQGMSPEDMAAEQKQVTAQMIRMAELMSAGRPATDPAVQAEVEQHHRWVTRYWTPSAQAYRNLGQMYVDDGRFRANYERITEGLAAYQRDAMAVYADERLS